MPFNAQQFFTMSSKVKFPIDFCLGFCALYVLHAFRFYYANCGHIWQNGKGKAEGKRQRQRQRRRQRGKANAKHHEPKEKWWQIHPSKLAAAAATAAAAQAKHFHLRLRSMRFRFVESAKPNSKLQIPEARQTDRHTDWRSRPVWLTR